MAEEQAVKTPEGVTQWIYEDDVPRRNDGGLAHPAFSVPDLEGEWARVDITLTRTVHIYVRAQDGKIESSRKARLQAMAEDAAAVVAEQHPGTRVNSLHVARSFERSATARFGLSG